MLTAHALSSGQVVSHLNEMGFECVINAKRDFYADIAKGKVSPAPAGNLVWWKRRLVARWCRPAGSSARDFLSARAGLSLVH